MRDPRAYAAEILRRDNNYGGHERKLASALLSALDRCEELQLQSDEYRREKESVDRVTRRMRVAEHTIERVRRLIDKYDEHGTVGTVFEQLRELVGPLRLRAPVLAEFEVGIDLTSEELATEIAHALPNPSWAHVALTELLRRAVTQGIRTWNCGKR